MTTFGACSLQAAAWACWTSSFILPATFDRLLPQSRNHLRITQPPDLNSVVTHLSNFISRTKDKALTEKEVLLAQGVIHFCLTEISHAFINSNHSGLRRLSQLPFVLLDNGDFIYASSVVFELETELSDTAIAPPAYLLPFEQLLTFVGAPSFQSEELSAPVVRIRSPSHISILSLGIKYTSFMTNFIILLFCVVIIIII
jgi:hypothetical protein